MTHIQGGGSAYIQQLLGSMTMGQLQALSQTNPAAAASLLDTFAQMSGAPLQQILGRGGVPGSFQMPSPSQYLPQSQAICGCGYRQTVDLKQGASNSWWSRNLGSRTEVAGFERLLKRDPQVRASFEQSIGGRIVDFGSKNDGVFTVERFPASAAPLPGQAFNPLANNALNLLGGMDAAVMQQAAQLAAMQGGGAGYGMQGMGSMLAMGGLGALTGAASGAMFGNPFMGMVTGGLGATLMGMGGGGGFGGGFGMLTGQGMGSWNPLAMPGRIQNSNPLYERAHQAQVASVMYDPSLTVEDKVTLMLMLIMKKQDRDIERQAMYINSIQQQQSNRSQMGGMAQMLGGVAGTVFGGPVGGMLGGTVGGMVGGGANSPSIDVETMKLKRMIDKRSQMFDMLRQIIDKYNETAKNIIQSIGR